VMKVCVRCWASKDLISVSFRVDGEFGYGEDSYIYCQSCIKELGWE